MAIAFYVLAAVAAAELLIIWSLVIQRSDLRQERDWFRQEAKRWEEEAVKRGWKNPFDDCLDTLNGGLAKLQAAAKVMASAAETQKANTAKLRDINRAARETNESLWRQNAALEKAAGQMDRAAKAAGAPRAPVCTRADRRVPAEDPLVRAALDRVEADLAAGRRETDPKKLN